MDPERTVTIELSYDEALVLSGWLGQMEQRSDPGTLTVGDAERIVLGQLDTALEPLINEVFNSNWDDVVALARARLRQRSQI